MSTTEVPGNATSGGNVDLKLEVVVIPVSDVDRAKAFYEGLGWRLDADLAFDNGFRIVQFTPPGLGVLDPVRHGLTSAAPGSAHEPASSSPTSRPRTTSSSRAVSTPSEVFHDSSGGYNRFDRRHERPGERSRPRHASYASFAEFSDPDGNVWLLQEITSRLPGRVDAAATTFSSVGDLADALKRAAAAHGEHEKRTGEADENWPEWYAAFMVAGADRRRAAVVSDYDVIVLGAGAPGEHCAGALAEGGLRVAVVERELVGGECSYWACIPSKTLLRPGEAVHDANEAAATRGGRRRRPRSPGVTSWCRTTPTPAPRSGSPTTASTCCAATAGSPDRARSRSTACGTPPSTSSWPPARTRSCRRSRASRELEGVWTNREVTGMTAVPRRLLILGGGPVGVEMAQAVRRLGGEVALVDVAERVLANEPAPLGEALGEVLRRDGIELVLGVHVDGGAPGRRRLRPRRSTTRPSCAVTACSSRPVAVRGSRASGSRPSASSPTPTGIPVDAQPACRRPALGDR